MITTEKCTEHLAGMVRIATVSNKDDALIDFSKFDELHEYLRVSYPLVHKTLTVEPIGPAGLIYHWKGDGSSKQGPLVLMAHQDVVPEGDHSLWEYPPFGGEVHDGFLWGRGSDDCKSNIMAYMEAIEHLIGEGFTPGYDLYIAMGSNEETLGCKEPCAPLMVKLFQERGIQPGCVIDEAGGVTKGNRQGYEGFISTILVSEKGYSDWEVYVEHRGGHSCMPPKDSAMKTLAEAILAIEANPFPYRICPTTKAHLEAAAQCREDEVGKLLQDIEGNWDKLVPYFDADPELAASFHTTIAITMAQGSQQSNILPQKASVIVNCRILEGDTLESMQKHFESILPEGAKIRLLQGENPQTSSLRDSHGYQLLKAVSEEMYPGVITVPGYALGGTDSRYFQSICDSVYRFCSIRNDLNWGPAHAANERVPVDCLTSGPEFLVKFLTRY